MKRVFSEIKLKALPRLDKGAKIVKCDVKTIKALNKISNRKRGPFIKPVLITPVRTTEHFNY